MTSYTSARAFEVVGSETVTIDAAIAPTDLRVIETSANAVSLAGSDSISTNALPRAISENWGKILRAKLTGAMLSNLTRISIGRRRPNARALTTQSLGEFLEFWGRVRAVAVEPEITAAPDGTLCAEWFKSPQQRLDVRFVPGRVMFGLFSREGILEGAESLDNVAKYLKSHSARPLQWFA